MRILNTSLKTAIKNRAVLPCIFLVLFAITPHAKFTSYAAETNERQLVLGQVSKDPEAKNKELQPILNYVVERMQDIGVSGGSVRIARDNQEMLQLLASGEVDWISETVASALLFENQGGAEMLFRRWKNGRASYSSMIFVRNDSGIESLNDLAGKTIAFEDDGSTSAYFLPAIAITDVGLSLELLDVVESQPSSGKVGYLFSKSETTTANWVNEEFVDAGALSSFDWASTDTIPDDLRPNFKVIHETGAVPRSVELIRGDLEPRIRTRLRSILRTIANDPNGAEVMNLYEGTTKFDRISSSERFLLDKLPEKIELLIAPQ
ncbi:MAG: PhnD/SsuA/transferrin family substrate-binding protein [Pseudomonadales bacterium]|nr:PhnD/SsuA/transferrin family substrate-binding protein [Pseudomonadales bacterium]